MADQHYQICAGDEVFDWSNIGLDVHVRRDGSDRLAEDERKIERQHTVDAAGAEIGDGRIIMHVDDCV